MLWARGELRLLSILERACSDAAIQPAGDAAPAPTGQAGLATRLEDRKRLRARCMSLLEDLEDDLRDRWWFSPQRAAGAERRPLVLPPAEWPPAGWAAASAAGDAPWWFDPSESPLPQEAELRLWWGFCSSAHGGPCPADECALLPPPAASAVVSPEGVAGSDTTTDGEASQRDEL
ncbi:hypothetical protein H696_04971 [Fonticula alba]|uniref:Uncharacterized protein n=1 Tax=Fonticula alba TaxID=691883 RepID=A0A058Z341_FONAL|nr:hypothetical protein H696_04971 [Fonticula alba]KCV68680.1 hypothetical protein H696_04971 [Fonticula alba]|eukprot:XP_009497112.1 hypothetical protein H696_04971 [Fonticula alba]